LTELNEDEEDVKRTVTVDQRVGERSQFKVVEAFMIPVPGSEVDEDGFRPLLIVDAEMIIVLPNAVDGDRAWFRGGVYLDSDDIETQYVPKGVGARKVSSVLGFDPGKLPCGEVVEVTEGLLMWAPLATVMNRLVVKKLKVGQSIPRGGTSSSDEIAICRHTVTEAKLEAIAALRPLRC
jgi:hypothetical protein